MYVCIRMYVVEKSVNIFLHKPSRNTTVKYQVPYQFLVP